MPLVIKYGGNAMTSPELRRNVAAEIRAPAEEGAAPVVVHGGGPFIKAALDRAGLEHRFIRGLRVTTAKSLPVVEQVLTLLNKELAQEIGSAVGLTARDASVVKAERFDEALGFVGRVTGINTHLLSSLVAAKLTPVIACLGENERGNGVLNVNADEIAGAVAGALGAPVLFLSDIPGVLDRPEDETSLLQELSKLEIQTRIADGRVSGGMIPKLEAALSALEQGASYAIIADGRDKANIRRALLEQTGTRIFA